MKEMDKKDYTSIIYTQLSIGSVFLLALVPVLIYLIYGVYNMFWVHIKAKYKHYFRFLEIKGINKHPKSTNDDNEVYTDVKKDNRDKDYYDNTSYDSITNEMKKNIDYHIEHSKEHQARNETFLKSLGYNEPLDTIDETAIIAEYDEWD